MGDILSYTIRDFLMFSRDVYWRLFALENEALWPLPFLAALAGVVAVGFLLWPRPPLLRIVGLLMSLACYWVAWHFLWLRFAPVNWPMTYAAGAFALQGLVMFAWAVGAVRLQPPGGIGAQFGYLLTAYAVAVHPLTALPAGRAIEGAEFVGIAPGPTAIALLGVAVAAMRGWWAVLAVPVPLLWCLWSALTLYALGGWQAWIPAGAAAAALAGFILRRP